MTRAEFYAKAWRERYAWAQSVDANAVSAFNKRADERIKRGKELRRRK